MMNIEKKDHTLIEKVTTYLKNNEIDYLITAHAGKNTRDTEYEDVYLSILSPRDNISFQKRIDFLYDLLKPSEKIGLHGELEKRLPFPGRISDFDLYPVRVSLRDDSGLLNVELEFNNIASDLISSSKEYGEFQKKVTKYKPKQDLLRYD